MSDEQDVIDGIRHCFQIDGENWYLFVSAKEVFVTVPRENDPFMTKTREIAERICSEITKCLNLKESVNDVL